MLTLSFTGSYDKLRSQITSDITYAEALRAMKISYGLLFQKDSSQTAAAQIPPPKLQGLPSDAVEPFADTSWLDSIDMGEWGLLNGFFGVDGLQLPQ
jgi:hypothetical protein